MGLYERLVGVDPVTPGHGEKIATDHMMALARMTRRAEITQAQMFQFLGLSAAEQQELTTLWGTINNDGRVQRLHDTILLAELREPPVGVPYPVPAAEAQIVAADQQTVQNVKTRLGV